MTKINPIRAWRIAHGVRVKQLADKVGVEPSAVCKWERDRVSHTKCLKLHEVTGIPLHRLRPDLYPEPQRKGAAA